MNQRNSQNKTVHSNFEFQRGKLENCGEISLCINSSYEKSQGVIGNEIRCSSRNGEHLFSNHMLNKRYTFTVRRHREFSSHEDIIAWRGTVRKQFYFLLILCQNANETSLSCSPWHMQAKFCLVLIEMYLCEWFKHR